MLKHELGFFTGGCLAFSSNLTGVCILGYDDKINREHTRVGHDLLTKLLPDFQRSFNLSRKFADQVHGLGRLQDRVDGFHDPAFIIGLDGKIDYMNESALTVLSQGRGVKARLDRKLTFVDGQSQTRYAQLLKQSFRGDDVFAEKGLPVAAGEVAFRVRGEPSINSIHYPC